MNILFVGDIFGSAGRRIVREHIGHVRAAHNVDLTIVNVENAAGGFGVTPQIAEDIFELGADVLTTGNHVWDKNELIDYLNSAAPESAERAAARAAAGEFSRPACRATASMKEQPQAAWTTRCCNCKAASL